MELQSRASEAFHVVQRESQLLRIDDTTEDGGRDRRDVRHLCERLAELLRGAFDVGRTGRQWSIREDGQRIPESALW